MTTETESFLCPSCEFHMDAPTKTMRTKCSACGHIEYEIIDPHPMWLKIVVGTIVGLPLFVIAESISWLFFRLNSVNNFFDDKMRRYAGWANKGNRNYKYR